MWVQEKAINSKKIHKCFVNVTKKTKRKKEKKNIRTIFMFAIHLKFLQDNTLNHVLNVLHLKNIINLFWINLFSLPKENKNENTNRIKYYLKEQRNLVQMCWLRDVKTKKKNCFIQRQTKDNSFHHLDDTSTPSFLLSSFIIILLCLLMYLHFS